MGRRRRGKRRKENVHTCSLIRICIGIRFAICTCMYQSRRTLHVHVHTAICVARALCAIPTLPTNPGSPAQLMRPGIGQNVSCALGDCLTSRPEEHLQPRELWFSIYSCEGTLNQYTLQPAVHILHMYVYMYI